MVAEENITHQEKNEIECDLFPGSIQICAFLGMHLVEVVCISDKIKRHCTIGRTESRQNWVEILFYYKTMKRKVVVKLRLIAQYRMCVNTSLQKSY